MNKKDMNSHFHFRRLKPTAIIMLLLLVSCTDKMELPTPGGNTVLPDGRVVYSLHTTAPDFARPVTRNGTANEDAAEGTPIAPYWSPQ